jgi:putative membrane protein
VGHLAQGFIPAMVIRELLLRHGVVARRGWLLPLVTLSCVGISGVYELLEWLTAEVSGESADAFLGTQGYAWDTQSDILMALVGSLAAQLSMGWWHDRQIAKMGG